ncbi:MAG: hypothetical protein AB7S83_05845 [Candidatus Methanomethylophilaceae archaeon]
MIEYEITMDECDLNDAKQIIDDASSLLRDLAYRRPGYSELGAALIYLAKARDMIDVSISAVRA